METCSSTRRLALAGMLAALVVAACGGGTQTTPTAAPSAAATAATAAPSVASVKLKVAVFGAIQDAGFFIAEDRGYFKNEGLDIEVVPSQNATQGITFLGSGQVDVAGIAPTPGLFNAIADGIKVKIVADKARIDPKHSPVALAVRKQLFDSGAIKSVKDLKGKKVGLPSLETGTGADLNAALQEGGLTVDDVTIIPGPPPDGYSSLKNGALDAAVLLEPFLATATADGTAKVLRLFGEVMPGSQDGVVAFGERMLNDKQLGARFMRAYLKALADFNAAFPTDGSSGKGRAEIVQILIKNTSVKTLALYDQMQYPYYAADGGVDTASIDTFQQFFINRKLQKKFVPASDYFVKIATQ